VVLSLPHPLQAVSPPSSPASRGPVVSQHQHSFLRLHGQNVCPVAQERQFVSTVRPTHLRFVPVQPLQAVIPSTSWSWRDDDDDNDDDSDDVCCVKIVRINTMM